MKDEMLSEYDFKSGIRGKYAKRYAEGIKLPQRKSVRLRYYDYRQNGAYFVTICAFKYACIFGTVRDNGMLLSSVGKIVKQCWEEMPQHFSCIELDVYAIMPNHFHAILYIVGSSVQNKSFCLRESGILPKSLSVMVRSFKSAVTKKVGEEFIDVGAQHAAPLQQRIWHCNYYERVIRNDQALSQLREYVVNNPLKWELDELNPDFVSELSCHQQKRATT